jgi:hypothetical protein
VSSSLLVFCFWHTNVVSSCCLECSVSSTLPNCGSPQSVVVFSFFFYKLGRWSQNVTGGGGGGLCNTTSVIRLYTILLNICKTEKEAWVIELEVMYLMCLMRNLSVQPADMIGVVWQSTVKSNTDCSIGLVCCS